ncbi:MAG: hypothetical protein ABFR75_14250 [Acidobacteriota bacterium]
MKKITILLTIPFIYTIIFCFGINAEAKKPVPPKTEIDFKIPEQVAEAALNAYKAKDVHALMTLSRPDFAARIKKMIEEGKTEDIKKRAFDENGWRYRSVVAWDGKLHEKKERGKKLRIRYGYIGANEVGVIELVNEEGKWYFEDLKSPSRETWESWGE